MRDSWDPTQLLARRARDLLANAGPSYAPPREQVLRLAAGVPDPTVFPVEELVQTFERMLRSRGELALQYGGNQGNAELRHALAERVNRQEGLALTADNFMLTGGAAQALENVCFSLVDPGDVVICENPTFGLSIRTIRAHEGELIGIPLDDDGPLPDAFERALSQAEASGRRAKFLYVTPNFQNPTAITFSLERRLRLLDLASRHGCLIVEDDAYGDLRFEGEAVPSFYALADSRGVIRMGSYSKTIGPGLRLGWTQAQPELLQALVAMRLDMGTAPLVTYLVAEFVASGAFNGHLERVLLFYKDKRDRFLAALGEHFDGLARWRAPEGGFFVWIELPEGVSGEKIAEEAMQERIMIAPGSRFYCQDACANYMRLAFSFIAAEEIETAVSRLAKILRRNIAAQSVRR